MLSIFILLHKVDLSFKFMDKLRKLKIQYFSEHFLNLRMYGDPFGKKDVRFSLTTSLGFSEAWLPLAAILRSLRYGFFKPGVFLRSPRLTTCCILYPVTAITKKVASIIHHCLFLFFTPLVV